MYDRITDDMTISQKLDIAVPPVRDGRSRGFNIDKTIESFIYDTVAHCMMRADEHPDVLESSEFKPRVLKRVLKKYKAVYPEGALSDAQLTDLFDGIFDRVKPDYMRWSSGALRLPRS